jgi:sirohydrochlorin ferrochelatase
LAEALPTLVLAAHGTQSAAGAATLVRMLRGVRALRPALVSRLCFVDVLLPSVDEELASLVGPVVIVPTLLSTGTHVQVDIPRAVGRRKQVVIARHLGPDRLVSEALSSALVHARAADIASRPVALVAAGSNDTAARDELDAAARDLATVLGVDVTAATMADADPFTAVAGVEVAPYLVAEGAFYDALTERATAAGAAIVSAPIGGHPAIAQLILARYDDAIATANSPEARRRVRYARLR